MPDTTETTTRKLVVSFEVTIAEDETLEQDEGANPTRLAHMSDEEICAHVRAAFSKVFSTDCLGEMDQLFDGENHLLVFTDTGNLSVGIKPGQSAAPQAAAKGRMVLFSRVEGGDYELGANPEAPIRCYSSGLIEDDFMLECGRANIRSPITQEQLILRMAQAAERYVLRKD